MFFFNLFADIQNLVPCRGIIISKAELIPHAVIYNKYTGI